jgi:hypothetical protein
MRPYDEISMTPGSGSARVDVNLPCSSGLYAMFAQCVGS